MTENTWQIYKKDNGTTWPPKHNFYLVWVNNLWGGNHRIQIASFVDNTWRPRDDAPMKSFDDAVTHWCKLPPEPKNK